MAGNAATSVFEFELFRCNYGVLMGACQQLTDLPSSCELSLKASSFEPFLKSQFEAFFWNTPGQCHVGRSRIHLTLVNPKMSKWAGRAGLEAENVQWKRFRLLFGRSGFESWLCAKLIITVPTWTRAARMEVGWSDNFMKTFHKQGWLICQVSKIITAKKLSHGHQGS